MSSVNKVILVGNLGKDPELRSTRSGHSVCNFSVATTYHPKTGEQLTEWHRIQAWGKQAEACKRYLSKGSKVYVEGRLQTRTWEKDGARRSTTEVIASTVVFLDSKRQRSEDYRPDYDADEADGIPF